MISKFYTTASLFIDTNAYLLKNMFLLLIFYHFKLHINTSLKTPVNTCQCMSELSWIEDIDINA